MVDGRRVRRCVALFWRASFGFQAESKKCSSNWESMMVGGRSHCRHGHRPPLLELFRVSRFSVATTAECLRGLSRTRVAVDAQRYLCTSHLASFLACFAFSGFQIGKGIWWVEGCVWSVPRQYKGLLAAKLVPIPFN